MIFQLSHLDGAPTRVGDEVHGTRDVGRHREPQQEVELRRVDLLLHQEDLEIVVHLSSLVAFNPVLEFWIIFWPICSECTNFQILSNFMQSGPNPDSNQQTNLIEIPGTPSAP